MKYHNIKLWKIKRFQFSMTKWYSKKTHLFYQPSLGKYNSCLCRTITGIFSTRKIARTCFCCPISIITMWKRRFWGGGASIYIYICMYIFTDSTFCYKKIPPFATPAEFTFPNSPWGSCCHVAKWHWPSCADSLKAIVLERICGGKILWRTVAQDLFFLTDGIVTLILLTSFTTMCMRHA